MNVMILKDNEEFSHLTSDVIARQHFIAYGDGDGHYRIVKDRQHNHYGVRISDKTLHWYLSKKS